ncbi:MAG TPA: hypothetical protein DDW73_10110, partial [Rhizobium sp.]|nr:hypothetical protein [Rhizobium sp.]
MIKYIIIQNNVSVPAQGKPNVGRAGDEALQGIAPFNLTLQIGRRDFSKTRFPGLGSVRFRLSETNSRFSRFRLSFRE